MKYLWIILIFTSALAKEVVDKKVCTASITKFMDSYSHHKYLFDNPSSIKDEKVKKQLEVAKEYLIHKEITEAIEQAVKNSKELYDYSKKIAKERNQIEHRLRKSKQGDRNHHIGIAQVKARKPVQEIIEKIIKDKIGNGIKIGNEVHKLKIRVDGFMPVYEYYYDKNGNRIGFWSYVNPVISVFSKAKESTIVQAVTSIHKSHRSKKFSAYVEQFKIHNSNKKLDEFVKPAVKPNFDANRFPNTGIKLDLYLVNYHSPFTQFVSLDKGPFNFVKEGMKTLNVDPKCSEFVVGAIADYQQNAENDRLKAINDPAYSYDSLREYDSKGTTVEVKPAMTISTSPRGSNAKKE